MHTQTISESTPRLHWLVADWLAMALLTIGVKFWLPVQQLDQQTSHWLHQFATANRTFIFNGLTLSGSPILTLVLGMLIALLFISREDLTHAALVLTSVLGVQVIAWCLKHLIQRPRPLASLTLTQGFSFPSGHVVGATMLVLIICHYWHPQTVRNRILEVVIAIGWLALVALSRVYLQAHYPTDVLGGMLLAWSCWQTVRYGFQQYRSRQVVQNIS